MTLGGIIRSIGETLYNRPCRLVVARLRNVKRFHGSWLCKRGPGLIVSRCPLFVDDSRMTNVWRMMIGCRCKFHQDPCQARRWRVVARPTTNDQSTSQPANLKPACFCFLVHDSQDFHIRVILAATGVASWDHGLVQTLGSFTFRNHRDYSFLLFTQETHRGHTKPTGLSA